MSLWCPSGHWPLRLPKRHEGQTPSASAAVKVREAPAEGGLALTASAAMAARRSRMGRSLHKTLSALAQSTRLDTFRLLVEREPDGAPAGELARRIGVPQNTMSAHLAVLARAGLIVGERQSRSIVYRANLDRLREMTLFLVKDCCGGRAELCAPLIADLTPCCPPAEAAHA
jgi:ArsR family transcriptional regulator, arsenate/arsenite/antimonite-responsive transcriptional repressor